MNREKNVERELRRVKVKSKYCKNKGSDDDVGLSHKRESFSFSSSLKDVRLLSEQHKHRRHRHRKNL